MAVASLAMYDLPEVRRATEAWWTGLARHLRRAGLEDVPSRPSWPARPEDAWRAPGLLLAQCCGYPLTHAERGRLQAVATPAYDAPGCRGTDYASLLIVRADSPAEGLAELAGGVCAVNARDSHSGYNALRAMLAPLAGGRRLFRAVRTTGSHPASLAAVAAGEADLCAVDCVVHALIARHGPGRLAGTRVLGHSMAAPGLPYVTRRGDGGRLARLREGLFAALADPGLAAAREALLLVGAEVLPEGAYERIVELERRAAEAGYPEIR